MLESWSVSRMLCVSESSPTILVMGKLDQGAEEVCSRCHSEAEAKLMSVPGQGQYQVCCEQVWCPSVWFWISWWGWFSSNREESWVIHSFAISLISGLMNKGTGKTQTRKGHPRNQGMYIHWSSACKAAEGNSKGCWLCWTDVRGESRLDCRGTVLTRVGWLLEQTTPCAQWKNAKN